MKGQVFWKLVLVLALTAVPLSAQIPMQSFQKITDEVVQQYYSFGISCQGEVIDVSIDEDTFPDSYLVQLSIRFSCAGIEQERVLAFVSDDMQTIPDQYRDRLKLLLRSSVMGEPDQSHITSAGPSGYWSTTLGELPVGSQVTVPDYENRLFARLAVSDQFTTSDESGPVTVTELEPIWTDRPLLPGMPLERDVRTGHLFFQVPISLNRIGISVLCRWPLLHSRFYLAAQGDLEWYVKNPSSYEIAFNIVLMRTSSVSSWNIGPDSLGAWWTQIHLGAAVYVTGGVLMDNVSSPQFLYGASVMVELTYQGGPHWFWGLSGGYRYRVVTDWQTVRTVQSNAQGVVLSPMVGWIW